MKKQVGPRYYGRKRVIDPVVFKTLKAQQGLTQETLAERAAVSVQVVQRAEQGENIEGWNAMALAKALDVPVNSLFTGASVLPSRKNRRLTLVSPGVAESPSLTVSSGKSSPYTQNDASDFVLSVDGIIINSVGELIFERVNEATIRTCRSSYRRSLEDLAFALVYGTRIRSKWNLRIAASQKEESNPKPIPEPGEALISVLPKGLYEFEPLDEKLRNGALLDNDDDRQRIRQYIQCMGQCMERPLFVTFCKDLLVREAEKFLGTDPSLFSKKRGPSDYKFGKTYYRHDVLKEVPKLLGKPALAKLVGMLPRSPDEGVGKKSVDRYADAALVQFVTQIVLTHLTTMYEYERNSGQDHRWRIPYALRSEVTRHFGQTYMQRELRHIVVRHALLFALRQASDRDSKESVMVILSAARDIPPFNEIRGFLGELNLTTLEHAEDSELRARKVIQEIFKAGSGQNDLTDPFFLAHSSVLRALSQADPDEYTSRLYGMFPELNPRKLEKKARSFSK